MRCLYCGNELALLKKLTGHGEFCSEAHRQKYQEQYNRLALTRLLQAQDTEAERRPLQVSARQGLAHRGSLGAGAEIRQIRSAPAAPPERGPEYPDLSGFLPHQFEPALSPAELFSSEPFLSAVTACLPSPASPYAMKPEPAGDSPESPSRRQPGGGPAESRFLNGLRLLEGNRPVTLTLQRIASTPIRDDVQAGFPFRAEFGATIQDFLTLLDGLDGVELPSLPRAAGQNGAGLNGRGHDAAPAVVRTPAPEAPDRTAGAAGPAPPPADVPPDVSGEPDAMLFESAGDRESSAAVVVNLDALKGDLRTPPAAARAGSAPVVVADSEEVRRFLGWLDEEAGELPSETAPAAVEEAAPEPAGEATAEAQAPEPPAPMATPREAVPVVHLEYLEVLLQLAGDAFAPIDEAEFAGPDFPIQTPAITTAPLRAKVVFGPSPEAGPGSPPALTPDGESIGGAVEEEFTPAPGNRGESESSVTVLPGGETSEGTLVRKRRRFEDTAGQPETPVAGPAQTAARLRSMAALARKAQQDLAGSPAQGETGAPATAPEPPSAPAAPAPDTNLESLRFEMERMGAPVATPSARSRRILVVAGLLLAMLLIGYLIKQAFASKPVPNPQQSRLEAYGPSMVSGDSGWSLWADQKGGAFPGRQIYIFRPSLSMSDYRIEFKGEIEAKGLGWFFRAANERNYYLMKLEMVKPGPAPKVMLSRTAVINGQETQKSQAELPMRVSLDTVYKVRTDVWRSTFKTYIQDQLVDTWVDDRLETGGFGLLRDAGERSQVRLIQLHGLRLVTQ